MFSVVCLRMFVNRLCLQTVYKQWMSLQTRFLAYQHCLQTRKIAVYKQCLQTHFFVFTNTVCKQVFTNRPCLQTVYKQLANSQHWNKLPPLFELLPGWPMAPDGRFLKDFLNKGGFGHPGPGSAGLGQAVLMVEE